MMLLGQYQSVTSRLETFLNFLRVSVSVSKILVSKKSLGIGLKNIWSRKKVSVSVSKILVSKKSLGIGLDGIFWSRHSVMYRAAFAIPVVVFNDGCVGNSCHFI